MRLYTICSGHRQKGKRSAKDGDGPTVFHGRAVAITVPRGLRHGPQGQSLSCSRLPLFRRRIAMIVFASTIVPLSTI